MSSPDESMKLTMIVLGGEPVRHLALSDKLDAQAAMPYLTCLVTPPYLSIYIIKNNTLYKI